MNTSLNFHLRLWKEGPKGLYAVGQILSFATKEQANAFFHTVSPNDISIGVLMDRLGYPILSMRKQDLTTA